MTSKTVQLGWNPCYRLIPSRFPPVSLFDRVASSDELDIVFALHERTNSRVRQELGEISLVPPEDRVFGPGSTPVMAAFCHLNADGSRFSDGTWGVYYGASSLEVAVAEVSFHTERFMGYTNQPAIDVDMRCYVGTVTAELHDLRGPRWKHVHDPDSYAASQGLAKTLRMYGSNGVVFKSVRHPGGECVGLFKPKAVKVPVIQGPHVTLQWDGQAVKSWYRKSTLKNIKR